MSFKLLKEKTWRINPLCEFYFHCFEKDSLHQNTIAFNKVSGASHVINSLCVDVFDVLRLKPLESWALSEILAKRNGFSLDKEWCAYINEMLSDLDRLGLIEPVVP